MLERRDFLLAERGADRDREMASGIQHNAAALVARLQATGTSGVRAALGGSPVAYGSLRAAKCILTRRDCDVNSLTRRGTKSRSGQEPLKLLVSPTHFTVAEIRPVIILMTTSAGSPVPIAARPGRNRLPMMPSVTSER